MLEVFLGLGWAGFCMSSDPALCVRRSAQQSDGPWFCSADSLWIIRGQRPGALQIAPAMVSQCHRSGSGLRGERESATGVSSYMAEGLDGTGFSSSPCQTVPHGGWGVGGWVERVLFSQRQHHGISLRLGFPKEWLFD